MALVLGVLEWMGWEVLTVAKERGIYIAARMVISVELLLCKLFWCSICGSSFRLGLAICRAFSILPRIGAFQFFALDCQALLLGTPSPFPTSPTLESASDRVQDWRVFLFASSILSVAYDCWPCLPPPSDYNRAHAPNGEPFLSKAMLGSWRSTFKFAHTVVSFWISYRTANAQGKNCKTLTRLCTSRNVSSRNFSVSAIATLYIEAIARVKSLVGTRLLLSEGSSELEWNFFRKERIDSLFWKRSTTRGLRARSACKTKILT